MSLTVVPRSTEPHRAASLLLLMGRSYYGVIADLRLEGSGSRPLLVGYGVEAGAPLQLGVEVAELEGDVPGCLWPRGYYGVIGQPLGLPWLRLIHIL
jgi:hypothetical protein